MLVLIAALTVGVALLVLNAGSDSDPELTSGSGSGPDEPGVEHVHGLGIDPEDRALVVATHLGSFRIPPDGGEAERIGDSYQDTMGFTVAGAGYFLGSGHPDVRGMRAGQPTRLGLIESTDGGASWTILSLGGEADFHGLAYAGDTIYGWDAGTGRFMVSSDKRSWETRSTLDLFGFAVDPGNGDHIIGAGPSGLLDSDDGGRTWRETNGPALVTLSWDRAGGLWGADPEGEVWQRGNADWVRKGTLPGEPQAFLVTADTLYAAAHDADDRTGIYVSNDGGKSWDLRHRDDAP